MTGFKEITLGLFGNYTWEFYTVYFIFVAIGVFASNGIASATRDKDSQHTPEKFSISYWFSDNWKRLSSSLAIIFIFIRFGDEMFHVVPTYVGAVGIGLGFDQFLFWIRQYLTKAKKSKR